MEPTLSVRAAVDKFVDEIKEKYRERRIIQEEQLLNCRSEKLIRLELVERKRLEHITRTPRAYSDLFEVELVERKRLEHITRTPRAYSDLFEVELVERERLEGSEQRGSKYGSKDSNITRTPLAYSDLFQVELVERERLEASKHRGVRKVDDEDSNVTRTPLAYADLFKVEKGKKEIKKILIDGDAGIGKTSFCIAVCEDWANGKIFQEFELVLLLPLRQQEVASVGSLFDLLKLFHPSLNVCELVKDYFEEDKGSILVIADGWDELGSKKHDKGTFLYQFLFGSQYYSVSTIVTSRPSASASLHHGQFIDRFTEIHGFDKEHVVEYIKSEFADDQRVASDILERLDSNPLVKSICSIPLICAIICHLWQTLKGDLPITMTGLYTNIIFSIILRSIHKFPVYENIVSLSSFDDLPESLQQSWWLLCEFAFQTLRKDQLVFSDKELMEFFPQGLSPGVNIYYFGLLQSSVSSLEVGCDTCFHFLHSTFQKYLAALFLVKQKSCEKPVADSRSLISELTTPFEVPMQHGIDSYLDDDVKKSDSVVLRFFFGIAYAFEIFQNGIGKRILTALSALHSFRLPSDLVLCHWAFEAQNDLFVHIVIDKLNGIYRLPDAIHDFIAVAYVIAKTPECTDKAISLDGHSLHDYNLTMLTDILSSKGGKLQVRSLNFRFNKLTDRGITGLFNRAAAAFQSLEYLRFYANMISGECINSILATLAQPFNKCREVTFSFENNPLGVPSLKVFRDALCHHQLCNLTKLNLTGSLSSDALANAEFIQALGHCRGLKILDLPQNNLHASGGRALGKILPQLSLEVLRVSNTNLGDEGMSALNQGLESACQIGELYLFGNDIHAAGILCLADSICAGKMAIKHHLELTGNSLGLKGAEAVVRLLSSKHFQAETVRLDSCGLTTASAHSISPHSSESVTCVGFREWVCGYEIKADGVKVLHLFGNNFSGEGIHVLAGFMQLCLQLRSLNCACCSITSNDLKQLLSLLSQLNLSLKVWNLYDNNLDDKGVFALIEHLPMFPSLTEVNIDGNSRISSEMCRNLKEICEKVP
jgi:Ran GTPase-activating protein (RanGAP) involved in mRNA processing and transport